MKKAKKESAPVEAVAAEVKAKGTGHGITLI